MSQRKKGIGGAGDTRFLKTTMNVGQGKADVFKALITSVGLKPTNLNLGMSVSVLYSRDITIRHGNK
jgi:hypothetical protein